MLRTRKTNKRHWVYVNLTVKQFYSYFLKTHLSKEHMWSTPGGSVVQTEAKSLHSDPHMLSLWSTFLCTLFSVHVFSLVYQ